MPVQQVQGRAKVPVALTLPRPLVEFLDAQARARFTSRNEVIQQLVVDAFHASRTGDA